jgi:hypothetical protein
MLRRVATARRMCSVSSGPHAEAIRQARLERPESCYVATCCSDSHAPASALLFEAALSGNQRWAPRITRSNHAVRTPDSLGRCRCCPANSIATHPRARVACCMKHSALPTLCWRGSV